MGVALRILILCAAIAAGLLFALDLRPLSALFLRGDPTFRGSFSLLHARAFLSPAAHLALIALALCVLRAQAPLALRARRAARIAFAAFGVEIAALLPCAFARDALCGVFYVLVAPFTAIAMLAAFALFVRAAGSRPLLRGALIGSASLAAAGATAWFVFAPKSAADCRRIEPGLARDNCLVSFALPAGDAALCDEVDFDSSRWSCLYEIAERAGNPSLCEGIAAPCRYTAPGPACEPERYRHTCWLVVARKLGDAGLCDRIGDSDQRSSCREQARNSTRRTVR
jgi:hypothetical protein